MQFDGSVSRRELLDLAMRASLVCGADLFFGTWLNAAQPHDHDSGQAPPQPDLLRNYEPKFFSADDFKALQAFTEILIPTDEDPGAREAYCAHFIDFVLQASSEVPQTQINWRHAMELLKDTGFYTASPERRLHLVTEMAEPETRPGAEHPAYLAYRLIKQQNAFAFYTSRVGMIDTLHYKGNSYNISFPACNHAEHQTV
jgi:hypothetical protein